jgi:NAD(P)-dependent dehydrogenase (short-subunit alcohol dehydrogenase family)
MGTILITGASSGIGKATAKYFAEKGWNVVATMRSPEKETELHNLERVMVLELDVEKKETIHGAIAQGIERFGKIDVLLNNAGYCVGGVFEAATEAQIHRQFGVNVFGLMNVTQAILPHFRTNKAGTIINISSVGGRITFPLLSLYHSTKFAVEGFSESLYYELAELNIKVKLVEPGSIDTDFTGRSLDYAYDEALTDYKEYYDSFLLKVEENFKDPAKISKPEVVAEVVFEAANDNNTRFRYTAGQDAEFLLHMRKEKSDEEFMGFIAQQF